MIFKISSLSFLWFCFLKDTSNIYDFVYLSKPFRWSNVSFLRRQGTLSRWGTADMTERRASWFALGLERGIAFGKRMTNKTKIMLLYNLAL